MGDRYHKAARDGLCEVLKEASKKEINAKDSDGMTPVLWSAFEGKLDAMKLLIGRGGNPDKTDQFGKSALHLASAKGHIACVDYLVKYGANIFALDIDSHNPQQLAAINNREEILRYLDATAAKLEATDKKKAYSMKEKAKKQADKRIKDFVKLQQKTEREHVEKKQSGMLSMLGNRTLRNLEGLSGDNEVLYVGTFQNSNSNEKRGKITDVFSNDSNSIIEDDRRSIPQGTLSTWIGQPDLAVTSYNEIAQDMKNQKPTGLFDKHMLGGALSIGQSVTSAISSSVDQASNHSSSESGSSKQKQKKNQRPQLLLSSDSEESDGNQNSSDENEESNHLKRFLAAYSLDIHFDLLVHHQIDLETLMILTEDDLKKLNLPLGPYRRLAVAIAERKLALSNP